ncbi:hypothetical protein TELCIR_04143 [Teladorsagia circumcincta]|uniref:Polypeptide N-acetylgalactosaminyltransferase n=1 Tax=Teladorsagia circumcincta TaxID=45464 RepID=A0A2G9UUG8_TELCI|nr:hypothetical protein TELCIR_04143 [Teladorsagia circumcincta]
MNGFNCKLPTPEFEFTISEDLKEHLDNYIRRFNGLVRVVRKNVRHGLIRAKIAGARVATGDVVVFLDSHCEANVGWSPTMAGGLLAANREYFFEVGAYDEEMDIWGGENLEISFRVWMCGGSIEFIPCSHVGHIFRAGHPYNMTGQMIQILFLGRGGNKDVHGTNSKRLAEVWMDEYKRLYYLHRHDLLDTDVGDLSARKALRKRLGCKSFKWYLDNVIPGKFILDEDVIAYGTLFTEVNNYRMCVDTLQRDEHYSHMLGVYPCQGKGSPPQLMSLSKAGHLRRETNCAEVILTEGSSETGKVKMIPCSKDSPVWKYEASLHN